MKRIVLLVLLMLPLFGAFGQNRTSAKKYSWQWQDTACNREMTFCWYGPSTDKYEEITAWGNRWVSRDKSEQPIESVLEIRCLKSQAVCTVAYNKKQLGGGTRTMIDLDPVREWNDSQIRTAAEGSNLAPKCEQDSILINRADASVTLIASPGSDADRDVCTGLFGKPKTVTYELEQ